jgi:hypothetical protein
MSEKPVLTGRMPSIPITCPTRPANVYLIARDVLAIVNTVEHPKFGITHKTDLLIGVF